MNPEQKPDQVVKIVKRAAFPFSDYHEDYTVRYCVRIDREVAKLNGGCGTQSFPNFLSHRYISSICLLSGHSALHLQYLCASIPLCPSLRCFFFFFFPSLGKGWVSMESSVPGQPSGTCAYSVELYGSH